MLFNLAEHGEAPKGYGQLTKGGVPGKSCFSISGCVISRSSANLHYCPAKVFTWVTSIATFGTIWTWGIILLSQIKYRKTLKTGEEAKLKYKMPLFPLTSYVSLAFLALVVVLMACDPDTDYCSCQSDHYGLSVLLSRTTQKDFINEVKVQLQLSKS